MKYWFYSEGNIVGPYEPAEMLALPAFADESLVCPESCTGDNPGDWRPASQVAEIAAAMSVGVGRMVGAGPLTSSYEYETGFSSAVSYFENKEPSPSAGYGELLDAIDSVLGAYKEPGAPAAKPESDYDFAEKFDIRLSRIQEELEAARWEKNLLLEKIRMKDLEEKKSQARIQELEARLKGERDKTVAGSKELEQVRHLADLKEKAETLRQIEEIKKEEKALMEEAAKDAAKPAPAPAPAAQPASRGFRPQELAAPRLGADAPVPAAEKPAEPLEVKTFKSIKRGAEIKLESAIGKEIKAEAEDESGITSRKFKSLGQTQPPAYVYGSHRDQPLPGPEAAPPGAFKPEALEPLPQQAGGLVYDFTVVTSRPDVQQFKIEPRQEAAPEPRPVKPPTYDMGIQQPAPAPAPAPAPQPQGYQFPPVQHAAPAPQPAPAMQPQHGFQFGAQPAPAAQPQPAFQFSPQPAHAPAAGLAPAAVPAPAPAPAADKAPAPAESPDKTQRMPAPQSKGKADLKAGPAQPKKKGGRTAFVAILVIFGSIAAGGLGYFFMGEGGGFGGLSRMIPTGKNPGAKTQAEVPAAEQPQAEQPAPAPEQPAPAPEQPAPAPERPAPAPAPAPSNENIKKALDIVKNYKLSGGRGTIASWFANSFVSSSGGANEEWTATPLHGDSLVVQYRLLRPKQEPLTYQFEVDAAKRDIVRGLNNNAIELLDSGKDKTVSAAPVKKPAKAKARKPARSKDVPILPLPDAPAAGGDQDPSGFENPTAEGSEQVKYLKAQESDEELF